MWSIASYEFQAHIKLSIRYPHLDVHRRYRLTLSETEVMNFSPKASPPSLIHVLRVLLSTLLLKAETQPSSLFPSLSFSASCLLANTVILSIEITWKSAHLVPSPLSSYFCPGGTPSPLVFTFTSQPTVSPTAVTEWAFHCQSNKLQPLFQGPKEPHLI